MAALALAWQVGYDQHGYAYRDLEGSKVHKALREDYGEAFQEVHSRVAKSNPPPT